MLCNLPAAEGGSETDEQAVKPGSGDRNVKISLGKVPVSVSCVVAAAGLLLSTARPATAQGWEYRASLYGWLAGLEGTIGVAQAGDGVPVEATFSDLAGFLDFAAAGHLEAQTDRFLLIGDINYVGLGAERDAEIGGQPVTVNMDYNQWIFELGGGYRLSSEFDALLVGRYYIQDLGETASAVSGSTASGTSHSWGDIYVGARWTKFLGDRWWFSLRADVGAGGSDFAWLGNAGFGYRFSELLSAGLAYRILSLDYETGSGTDYYRYDVAMNGLGLVLAFTF